MYSYITYSLVCGTGTVKNFITSISTMKLLCSINTFWTYLLLSSVSICHVVTSKSPVSLTPLIQSGNIREARKLSLVGPLPGYEGPEVTSYSGFISLNTTSDYEAETFFWFFPAFVSFLSYYTLI